MTYDPPHMRGSGPELLLAKKQAKNRTPNFHFFDLTRGYVGGEDKLTKKSGCYLGKLRANAKHTENVLFGAQSDKTELATIVFMRPPLASQLKEGVHPRRMAVVLPPPPAADGTPANRAGDALVDMLAKPDRMKAEGYSSLESKEPVLQNGNYRLDFKGRVTVPSVKNFQLVIEGRQQDDVICQFGKVGDDEFHLDFKAPLNPLQAFALAVAHFNF